MPDLEKYRAKRDPERTPDPFGAERVRASRRGGGVAHKHPDVAEAPLQLAIPHCILEGAVVLLEALTRRLASAEE